jgi:hypothetical protein
MAAFFSRHKLILHVVCVYFYSRVSIKNFLSTPWRLLRSVEVQLHSSGTLPSELKLVTHSLGPSFKNEKNFWLKQLSFHSKEPWLDSLATPCLDYTLNKGVAEVVIQFSHTLLYLFPSFFKHLMLKKLTYRCSLYVSKELMGHWYWEANVVVGWKKTSVHSSALL